MVLIDIIAGARPNFMKIASIIRALEDRQNEKRKLNYRLVHTGQHYDASMSGTFFDQLGIPEPEKNLGVGSGTQAEQTAAIMMRYESLLLDSPCNLCLVVGDVTSTMACSIAAQKLHVPVAHVEGGLRSGDWSMPEEINRIVTDSITNWFFTTSEIASKKLREVGVESDRIFFVGNTMIDTLLANMNRLRPPSFWKEFNLKPGDYFVATLHRPANVDIQGSFKRLLLAICEAAREMLVIFPVHPRTSKVLEGVIDLPLNLRIVEPQSYLEFNYLVKNSKAVITDSGGITEETTVMGIPCMTLRNTTERPETIEIGTNELIGTDPARLKPYFDSLFAGNWKKGQIPTKWDGRAGERIVAILERLLHN